MIIVDEKQTLELLTPEECIPMMREALLNVERGVATQYLRTAIPMKPGKILGFMPTWYNDKYYGAKVISVFPGNLGTGHPSHIGRVLLFDSSYGEILGMVDGTAITKVRTGCVSAVATEILARKDAKSLAIIGAGAQGRSHYAAIRLVRDIETVNLYDLHPEYAEAFAEEIRQDSAVTVNVCSSVREATRDADIICTLTHASEPFLQLADVKLGAHINAVGACAAKDREIASDLVAEAHFFGDNWEAVSHESGDFLYPLQEGRITEAHYSGNIAGILTGAVEGRRSDEEITVFEALGLAVEDVAAAIYVYEKVAGRR